MQEIQQHHLPCVASGEKVVLETWNVFPLLQAFNQHLFDLQSAVQQAG